MTRPLTAPATRPTTEDAVLEDPTSTSTCACMRTGHWKGVHSCLHQAMLKAPK